MLRQLYDYDCYNTRLQDELHLPRISRGKTDDDDAYSFLLTAFTISRRRSTVTFLTTATSRRLQACSCSCQTKMEGGKEPDNDAYLLTTFEESPGAAFMMGFFLLRLLYLSELLEERKEGFG